MMAKLPELNQRWQETLHDKMTLAIGVNTGTACVGNLDETEPLDVAGHGRLGHGGAAPAELPRELLLGRDRVAGHDLEDGPLPRRLVHVISPSESFPSRCAR